MWKDLGVYRQKKTKHYILYTANGGYFCWLTEGDVELGQYDPINKVHWKNVVLACREWDIDINDWIDSFELIGTLPELVFNAEMRNRG